MIIFKYKYLYIYNHLMAAKGPTPEVHGVLTSSQIQPLPTVSYEEKSSPLYGILLICLLAENEITSCHFAKLS